jgi:hypothetical protein
MKAMILVMTDGIRGEIWQMADDGDETRRETQRLEMRGCNRCCEEAAERGKEMAIDHAKGERQQNRQRVDVVEKGYGRHRAK